MKLTKTFIGLSLRKKMIIAFAGTLLPMIIMTIIAVLIAEQGMVNAVFEQNRILAATIADDVDQSIMEKNGC